MDLGTLVYNSGKIKDLGEALGQELTKFVENVDEMFHIINVEMNQMDVWTGSVYVDFRDKCNEFRKTRIEAMINNLKAYVTHFDKTYQLSEETTTQAKGIVSADKVNTDLIGNKVASNITGVNNLKDINNINNINNQ